VTQRRGCPAFAALLKQDLTQKWPGQSVRALVVEGVIPQAAYAWARGERVPTLEHLLGLQAMLDVPASTLVAWLQALGTDGVGWAGALGLLLHEYLPRAQWGPALSHMGAVLGVDVGSAPVGCLTRSVRRATDAQKA